MDKKGKVFNIDEFRDEVWRELNKFLEIMNFRGVCMFHEFSQIVSYFLKKKNAPAGTEEYISCTSDIKRLWPECEYFMDDGCIYDKHYSINCKLKRYWIEPRELRLLKKELFNFIKSKGDRGASCKEMVSFLEDCLEKRGLDHIISYTLFVYLVTRRGFYNALDFDSVNRRFRIKNKESQNLSS